MNIISKSYTANSKAPRKPVRKPLMSLKTRSFGLASSLQTGMEDWGYGAAGDQNLELRFLHSASTLRPSLTVPNRH